MSTPLAPSRLTYLERREIKEKIEAAGLEKYVIMNPDYDDELSDLFFSEQDALNHVIKDLESKLSAIRGQLKALRGIISAMKASELGKQALGIINQALKNTND